MLNTKYVFICSLLLSVVATEVAAEPDKIMLFRHGEKAAGKNPHLTSVGKRRAAHLVSLIKADEKVTIFSSDYNRTKETAADLVLAFNKPPIIYDARYLEKLKAPVLALNGTVVVIGHSNTTPNLAQRLSGEKVSPMPETQFNRYFVLEREQRSYKLSERLMKF